VITPADVVRDSSAATVDGTAGASVMAGSPVYKDTADDDNYKPCDATTAETAEADGIALHAAEDQQPLRVLKYGELDLGAVMTQGEIYVVSQNAGKIMPAADLVAGDYVTVVGVAISSETLQVKIIASGVASLEG
jgi:hypothetical protein